MNLDILTPKGQQSAQQQIDAINAILAQRPGTTFIHTALDGPAAVDGFFIRDGEIRAVAEVKCRVDMDYAKFMGERKGEWLITNQKIEDMRILCAMLQVPGFGVLYLVNDGLVLMRKLVDSTGQTTEVFRIDDTRTQRTVNGGSAMRANAFIPMHNAHQFRV